MNDLDGLGVFLGFEPGIIKKTYWEPKELPTKEMKNKIAGKLKQEEFIPQNALASEKKLRKVYFYYSDGRVKATITDKVAILESDLKEIKNG